MLTAAILAVLPVFAVIVTEPVPYALEVDMIEGDAVHTYVVETNIHRLTCEEIRADLIGWVAVADVRCVPDTEA